MQNYTGGERGGTDTSPGVDRLNGEREGTEPSPKVYRVNGIERLMIILPV